MIQFVLGAHYGCCMENRLERFKKKSRETKSLPKSRPVTHRDAQDDGGGSGKKWSDSQHTLKAELT